jgi:hypothetical protein
MRKLLVLAAGIAWLGASPAPGASPLAEASCPHAAPEVDAYDALAMSPGVPADDVIAAALDASGAYDRCAAFASTRGYVEDLHYAQVRSARYHYAAGRLYFSSGDYAQARRELGIARALVADTIDWMHPSASKYRAEALAVRDDAGALLAKIPLPTGISTAPARTPATTPAPQ